MFTCLKGSSVWELKAFVMCDFQGSSCQRPHLRRLTRSLTRSILLALILIFKILLLLSRLKNRKIRFFFHIYTIDLVSAVQNAGYVRDK